MGAELFNLEATRSGGQEDFRRSRNMAIINGDSRYNRRRGKGRSRGERYPFGVLVDIMPQSDMKRESIGSKTIQGIFFGNPVHARGLWSGDYIVADFTPVRKDCDVLGI